MQEIIGMMGFMQLVILYFFQLFIHLLKNTFSHRMRNCFTICSTLLPTYGLYSFEFAWLLGPQTFHIHDVVFEALCPMVTNNVSPDLSTNDVGVALNTCVIDPHLLLMGVSQIMLFLLPLAVSLAAYTANLFTLSDFRYLFIYD